MMIMKKGKKQVKGFTLVELIVVIAIIGVLAAILIPSMLGYVNRAKMSGINSSAKSLYNAAMAACRETDVVKPIPEGIFTKSSAPDGADADLMRDYVYNYFDKAKEIVWGFRVEGDVVVGTCISKSADDQYVGTYPHPNNVRGPLGSDYEKYINFAQNGTW